MNLPRPESFTFEGMHFDFGHQYGYQLRVEVNGYHVWSKAVRFFTGHHTVIPERRLLDEVEHKLVNLFWRRLGAA